jgi:hypothetical protein
MSALTGPRRRGFRSLIHDVQGVDDKLDRIEALTRLARVGDNTQAKVELLHVRHRIWQTGQYPEPPSQWPPETSAQNVQFADMPEISADQLTADVLHTAIRQQSCLLVHHLMSEQGTDELIAGTDRALDALHRLRSGDKNPALSSWFQRFVPRGSRDINAAIRIIAAELGTVFAAESPSNFIRLLDIVESLGILRILTEYFGVRPVLSVGKTVLKKVVPGTPGGWHQDITAFGHMTRAINMWVALTPCGREAPGLELVPTNPGGPVGNVPPPPPMAVISDAAIDQLAAESAPRCEPEFEKGDALFFDTLLPHQTQQGAAFIRTRYALECWFFAPTTVDKSWIPLHV